MDEELFDPELTFQTALADLDDATRMAALVNPSSTQIEQSLHFAEVQFLAVIAHRLSESLRPQVP